MQAAPIDVSGLAGHAVTRAVQRWCAAPYAPAGAPLVVACSGGADSLALAGAVLAARPDRALSAAVVDHALQPGSAAVADQVSDRLSRMGFGRVDVLTVDASGPGGVEAAARAARYAALRALARSIDPRAAVLLAHTADDQAESVLLGLARGSGPRSIAGMCPWRNPWGRPFLDIRRAETENACAAIGLDPWRDPHNENPAFTRVRLRREVLPLMDDALGGGVIPALARTAELMRDDLAALDEIAERALSENCGSDGDLDCPGLAGWPSAVRRRALRTWAAQQQGITTLTFRNLVSLENIVIRGRTGQSVRLPGAIDAVRRRTVLALRPATPDAHPDQAGWQAVRHEHR
jgi:tRNA(Ile)-lysidine synthase